MCPDLETLLRARYPAMLPTSRATPVNNGRPFDFMCDDGWFLLIANHFATLQAMADDSRIARPVVSRVKQKFGQLLVYLKTPLPRRSRS